MAAYGTKRLCRYSFMHQFFCTYSIINLILQKYNITTDELCSCVERKQEQQIIAGFMKQVPHYVTSDKDNLQAAISKILSAAKKCEKNAEVAKQISKDSSVYIAQKCHEHAYKESVEIIRQTFNL